MANGNYTAYDLANLELDINEALKQATQGQIMSDLETREAQERLTEEAALDLQNIEDKIQEDLDKGKKDYGFKSFFDNPIGKFLASSNPFLLAAKTATEFGAGIAEQRFEENKLKKILDSLQSPELLKKYKGTRVYQGMLDNISQLKEPIEGIYGEVSDIGIGDILKSTGTSLVSDLALTKGTERIKDAIETRLDAKKIKKLLPEGMENLTTESVAQALSQSPDFLKILQELPEGVSPISYSEDIISRLVDSPSLLDDLIGVMPGINKYGQQTSKQQQKDLLNWLQGFFR
jgi:hypothetical protein